MYVTLDLQKRILKKIKMVMMFKINIFDSVHNENLETNKMLKKIKTYTSYNMGNQT